MGTIKEALTFDDVLMLPRFSSILPSNTDISLKLTNNINLKVPFLSSAMDTVTESSMAIAMAQEGGIGVKHGYLTKSKKPNKIEVITISMVIAKPYVCSMALDFLKMKMTIRHPNIKNQFMNGIYI